MPVAGRGHSCSWRHLRTMRSSMLNANIMIDFPAME
jgi:hypothetical protein